MSTAVERFDRIWKQWGLKSSDEAGAQARRRAVSALESWLSAASTQPSRMVRAVQTLLADPENPEVSARPSILEVSKAIQSDWANFGGADPGRDLQFLQAMLLAVWPTNAHPVLGLAALLDSPWQLTRGRNALQSAIQTWQGQRSQMVLLGRSAPSLPAMPTLRPVNISAGTMASGKWPAVPAQLHTTQRIHNGYGQAEISTLNSEVFSTFITELQAAASKQGQTYQQAVDTLAANISAAVNTQIQMLVSAQTDQVAALRKILQNQAPSPELALLWWGQARYSYRAKMPFRQLQSPSQVLAYAADELAERALELPPEPTCAYLLEFLHALGQDLTEARPLRDWCAEYLEALSDADHLTETDPALAALVQTDALGMPVTWLHLHKGQSIQKVLPKLSDACLLPVQETLTRADWACWVLRERLLSRHWTQHVPAKK